MEFRVLRYFLAVAREENISKAAESLYLTQPTLSKQLMELEAELGKTLLIRGKRKITLTEDGMLLRKRAQEIADLMEKTEAELRCSDDLITGSIYIGCGETDRMRIVTGALKVLHDEYPDIQFCVFSGNGDDVLERLEKGLVDFGVVIGTFDVQKYNYLKLPAKDTWGLLMRKDDPLARQEFITPEDMWKIPLLCSRQSLVGSELSSWLQDDFEKLHIVGRYNLIFNAALMVEDGIGCALCLDQLIPEQSERLCFRPFRPVMESEIRLIWKKYAVLSKASEKFLEVFSRHIAGDEAAHSAIAASAALPNNTKR